MAATKDLTVRLIGKDQGALQSLTGLGAKADETGKKTQSMGNLATGAMLAMGAAATGLALKAAGTFESVGLEVVKLQRYTGGSAEEMSKLRYAAFQSANLGVDVLTKSLGIASKNLEKSKDPMKDFGLAARDSQGNVKPMTDVLLLAADRFKGMENGSEKTALAMKLFGRAGADMIPFLNGGADGIQKLMDKAQEAGVVLSGDDLKAVLASKRAHRELDSALEGLGITIGRSVVPLLTSVTQAMAKIPGPLAEVIAPVALLGGGLLGLVAAGSKVVGIFSPMVTKIREMDAATSAAGGAAGNLGQKIGASAIAVGGAIAAYEVWNLRMKEAEKNANSLGEIYETKLKGATTFAELGRQLDVTRTQVKSLSDEVQNSSAPWDADVRIEMTKYQGELMKVADANQRLQEEIKQYAQAHNISVDAATNAIQKQHAEAEAQKALQDATEGTTVSIEDQVNALRASIDPLFAAENATRKNEDAQKAAREANDEVTRAQKAYNEQSAIWGTNSLQAQKAWNDLADATKKKSEADTATVKSAEDLYFAQLKLEDGIKSGTISMDAARGMLDQWVAQGAVTKEQADQMAWKFLVAAGAAHQIPPTINTTVTADTSQAMGALAALGGLAAGLLKNAEVQRGLDAVKRVTAGMRVDGARASGGPVTGGGTYLVGERGPELFMPGTSGSIIANGAKGTRGNPYEDGSFRGMTAADRAAQDFVESIQRQQALRANPGLQGKPGWGAPAGDPFVNWGKPSAFAGWDPNADFSNWGKPAAAPKKAVAAGAGGVTVNLTVMGSVSTERDLVEATRNGVIEAIRRTGGSPTTYFGG